jgi:hypothetical protein
LETTSVPIVVTERRGGKEQKEQKARAKEKKFDGVPSPRPKIRPSGDRKV